MVLPAEMVEIGVTKAIVHEANDMIQESMNNETKRLVVMVAVYLCILGNVVGEDNNNSITINFFLVYRTEKWISFVDSRRQQLHR